MANISTFIPVVYSDKLEAGYFNGLYTSVPKIQQVYTGTGFDSSRDTAGSDEDDHEMDAIASTKTAGATYVRIKILYTTSIKCYVATSSQAQIKIQSKEVGGSYADIVAYKDVIFADETNDRYSPVFKSSGLFEYTHTLTSGEKTNGIQIKVFSKSTTEHNDGDASLANIQTIIELI